MVSIERVSLGVAYPHTPRALRVIDAFATFLKPSPSSELLRIGQSSAVQGLIDETHETYPAYRDAVLASIERALAEHTLVVCPEFSFCGDLEYRTRKLVDSVKARCIVVGGSYYRQHDGEMDDVCCPIFIPERETYYQQKSRPAPREEPLWRHLQWRGMDGSRNITLFTDTGYGDFAVQICSDALPEVLRDDDVLTELRGKLDFLVVVARNRPPGLADQLRAIARTERWGVIYCNGDDSAESERSAIFTPWRGQESSERTLLDGPVNFSVDEMHRAIADDLSMRSSAALGQPVTLQRRTDTKGFSATPRHWPFKGRRALNFGRYLKVLAIGSHFDDVWLGCLGSLMLLAERYDSEVICTSLCETYEHDYFGKYPLKNRTHEIDDVSLRLCQGLGLKWYPTEGHQLRDRDFGGQQLSEAFEQLKKAFSDVDLIFVPRSDDLNAEHRETARKALVIFQSCDVFEYEIKDFRRHPFNPNVFVDLSGESHRPWPAPGSVATAFQNGQRRSFAEKKADAVEWASEQLFSQVDPVFSRSRTLGRMSFRAGENAKSVDYAEAFVSELII